MRFGRNDTSRLRRRNGHYSQCYSQGDFYKYFKENMEGLGLTVPTGLFETQDKALDTAVKIASAISQLGSKATVAQALASSALSKLIIYQAMLASAYVGAVIGSIFVAIGRTSACGTSIADFFAFVQSKGLTFDNWKGFYISHPEIFDPNHKLRSHYAFWARSNSEAIA